MARMVETGGSGVSPTIEKLTSTPPAMFVQRTVKQLKMKSVIENKNEMYHAVKSGWKDVIQQGIDDMETLYLSSAYEQRMSSDIEKNNLTSAYNGYQEVKIDKTKIWDKIIGTNKRKGAAQ